MHDIRDIDMIYMQYKTKAKMNEQKYTEKYNKSLKR